MTTASLRASRPSPERTRWGRRAVRALVPEMPILVPGIGTQGGDLQAVLADGPTKAGETASVPGRGLLVNVSRGIARAALDIPAGASDGELESRLAAAARDWAGRLPVLP